MRNYAARAAQLRGESCTTTRRELREELIGFRPCHAREEDVLPLRPSERASRARPGNACHQLVDERVAHRLRKRAQRARERGDPVISMMAFPWNAACRSAAAGKKVRGNGVEKDGRRPCAVCAAATSRDCICVGWACRAHSSSTIGVTSRLLAFSGHAGPRGVFAG